MSVHYGDQLPQSDKLELCLDGASKNIDGQTWKGYPFDCVMVNSPSYTQLGSVGYWTLNGSNQYGYIKEAKMLYKNLLSLQPNHKIAKKEFKAINA